jgi:hypothetical protein
MAPRRPRPGLLNPTGQRLIKAAFDQRTRKRGDYHAVADGYIRALKDHGLLAQYLIPGVDPLEVLKTEAARNVGE